MKLTTTHLSCEHGFVSIIVPDGDNIECGRIRDTGTDDCLWPDNLGEEPDWFFDEVSELVSQILDRQMEFERDSKDYQAQITADYLRGKGAK